MQNVWRPLLSLLYWHVLAWLVSAALVALYLKLKRAVSVVILLSYHHHFILQECNKAAGWTILHSWLYNGSFILQLSLFPSLFFRLAMVAIHLFFSPLHGTSLCQITNVTASTWQKLSPAFVSQCARKMDSMFWAEVLRWDESFSAGCLCVFRGRHLELQTWWQINREWITGWTSYRCGLQPLCVPSVIKRPKGCLSDTYVQTILFTTIGSMQVAPWHAAPGFCCMVQPKSLLHSVAKGRGFFWLLQPL